MCWQKNGGALKPIADTVKFFVGSPLGSGDQFVSWIHIDDVCGMFIKAIKVDTLEGAINVVAPVPVTNKQLTKAIAQHFNRPLILPNVPAFALRILLGEMADIVVTGNKVSSDKVVKAGYQFKFTELDNALSDLLVNKH